MCYTFDDAQQALEFATGVGMLFTRSADLPELETRELLELNKKREWVLGIKTEYCLSDRDQRWCPILREYISLSSFHDEHAKLGEKRLVRIVGYYCYQLDSGNDSLTHLEDLGRVCLDKQLRWHTGDGYSSLRFHDDDNDSKLSAGNVIVHKATGRRFFVPPAPLERFE